MGRLAGYVRRYGMDVLIVLAAIEIAVEVALRGPGLLATPLWFAAPAIAVVILPLLARRRFPFAAPVAVWVLAAGLSFVDGQLVGLSTTGSAAGLVAACLLGSLADRVYARIGLAVVLAGAVSVIDHNPGHAPGDLVVGPVLFLVGWLAGFALRARAVQAEEAELRVVRAERERAAATRLAVAEERARIARELHDIVAHAMSMMVLQVGAVRHRLPANLADDRDALIEVERAGRAALTEMRRLVGAMHSDEAELAPQPGLGDLGALAGRVGRAGLPVRLLVEGQVVALPPAIDLSAYRIVQEGLTNSLKHAHATQAAVTVRYAADELELEVSDDGVGPSSDDGSGGGHGLVGIGERVKIYGGELAAGAGRSGGFVLRARLPLEGRPA